MSKNHGPDSSYLAKVAQFEREKQQRREMRRKAAKKKAKDKENIRKQRHIAKRLPTPVIILGVGGGDAEKWNPESKRWEKNISLQFQPLIDMSPERLQEARKIYEEFGIEQACKSLGVPKHIIEGIVPTSVTDTLDISPEAD